MKGKHLSVHPRSLGRSVASAEFERQDVTNVNDKLPGQPGTRPVSRFSLGWKQMAAKAAAAKPKKKKGAHQK